MSPGKLRYQTLLLLMVLGDLLCAVLAYAGAFVLRSNLPLPFTTDLLPGSRMAQVNHPLLFIALTQIVLLYVFGLYDLQALKRRSRLFLYTASVLGVQLLATAAWYFLRGDFFYPRSVLVVFWAANAIGVAGLRLWVRRRLRRARPSRILLVGTPEEVRGFLAGVADLRPVADFRVCGLIAVNGGAGKPPQEMGVPWLGGADDLTRIVREVAVDDVVLLSPGTWKDALVHRLLGAPCEEQGGGARPRVLVVPSVYDILVGRVSSLRLHDVPLIEVLKDTEEDLAFLIKSALDKVIAAALLAVGIPVLAVAAFLIKLSSPGPVLYRQRRVGKGGKEFVMYKLRTMVDGAEDATGPVLAQCGDQRVTRVGRFLRAARIDEIPQLLNALNGTMSLVGPRPERPEFCGEFLRTIPGYAERLQVKPGLTGLAQVNGEYHTTPEYKLKYDLAYIYNYSLWLDMRILAETVKVVLTSRGV